MKLVIISDTHFGDPDCSMVSYDAVNGKYIIGSKYEDFLNAAGSNNDYLVLVGDILDFSIASYKDAYNASSIFFKQITIDKIAKEVIILAGNHDASLYNIIMHEINVINRIKDGKPVEVQRHSIPAVLKDGPNQDEWLTLPNVSINPDAPPKYGKIYLTDLTKYNDDNPVIPFNFAYPNLYMITKQGEGVLITHGHYFEAYWSFMGEFAKIIAREDLKLRYGDKLDIDEYVSVNFPLNELLSSGVGQAGPLTTIIRDVQKEVKNHQLDRINNYFNRFKKYADKVLSFEWYKFYKEFITDKMLDVLGDIIFNALKDYNVARYNANFINKEEVRQRFFRYYNASTIEAYSLNEEYGKKYKFEIPPLTKVIFGHTHEPILYEDEHPQRAFIDSRNPGVKLYNFGGWLWQPETQKVGNVNAAVYTYDSKVGFRSKLV